MLKKRQPFIKLLLLITFIFSCTASASAAAFSDVNGSNAQESAIYKLNSLGILDGYPDGTFRPEQTITRAEFAKIAVITAGLETVASSINGTSSSFSDVGTSFWANGWINAAAARGLVTGYPDGTFAPQKEISQAEVLTVLLRILGYNDKLDGTWPTNYIAKGVNLGMLDDVTFVSNQPASRGEVAVLASAALNQNIVEFRTSDNVFKEISPVTSLLVSRFKDMQDVVNKAVVSSVSMENGEVTFTFDGKTSLPLAANCVFSGAANWTKAAGRVVDYMESDGTIMWINVRDYSVVKVTDSADIKAAGSSQVRLDGRTYKAAAAYSDPTDLFTDFLKEPAGTTLDTFLAPLQIDNAEFTLNEDGDIVFAKINTYASVSGAAVPDPTRAGIIDQVNTKFARLILEASQGTIDLDENDTQSYYILKDDAAASFSDLKPGDMVWYYDGAYDVDFLVASSKSVTGMINSYETSDGTPNKINLGNNTYDIAPGGVYLSDNNGADFSIADTGALDEVLDNAATAVLTPTGKIAALVTGAGVYGKKYAVINTNNVLRLINGEITRAIEVVNTNGTLSVIVPDENSKYWYDGTWIKLNDAGVATLARGALVEYSISPEGYINQLKANTDIADTISIAAHTSFSGYADNDAITIDGVIYDATNAVIFDLSTGEDDYGISSLSTFLNNIDEEQRSFAISTLAVVKDGVLKCLLIKDAGLTGSSINLAMVADTGTDTDGNYAMLLNEDGTTTRYTIGVTGTGLAKNKVIAYKLSSGDLTNTNFSGFSLRGSDIMTIDKISNTILTLDGVNYYVDDNTQYWDSTGEDPAVIELGDLETISTVKIFRKSSTGAIDAIQVVNQE